MNYFNLCKFLLTKSDGVRKNYATHRKQGGLKP